MSKAKGLQYYVISSWLLSGVMTIATSLLIFVLFGYYSYNQANNTVQSELDAKTETAARRISGELLIAPRGAPDAVSMQLQKELALSEIHYGTDKEISKFKKEVDFIYSQRPIPFLEDKYSILTSSPKVSFAQHLNVSVLFFAFLLIGIFVGCGLFLQTRYLRKHIISPIKSLVDTSTGERIICEQWPLEIQEISNKLSSSFQEREQVVYSQIARGVIHDIKTILQSMQVAVDLANESPSESRLHNLLKVSKAKLPPLLEIIDTALDGSREISIRPKNTDLIQTVQRSIDTSKQLPISQNSIIELDSTFSSLELPHDPVQLERVFTNLIKNAFEAIAAKDNGERKIRVSFKLDDKNFVGVSVEDSGVGLPKQGESIFRLLKSTKTHGSGLGLRVSRKIVEAHGGTLQASQSVELKGAKLEIKIPMGGQI